MSTIPVIQPANPSAPLPVTGTTAGVVASVNAIAQDADNFLPIFNNASVAVKTAKANAQAAGLDAFHTDLAVFIAADQAITPYVPYAPVQAFGGIGALAATFLGLIPNKPTATATAVGTAVSAAMTTVQMVPTAPATYSPAAPAAAPAPVSPTQASADPTVASLEAEVTSQEQQIAALEAQLAQKIAAPAASASATAEDPRMASAAANPATAKLSGGGLGGFFRGVGHEVAHPTETLQSAEAAAAKKS